MGQAILTEQAPRVALMKLLDGLLDRQLIYIHAPPGFGKTASALLWLEHRCTLTELKRSWISLDEYDNKTAEFCKRVLSALSDLQLGNGTLHELAAHPAFNTAPIEFTLYALSAFTDRHEPCIFVLDDLHVIKNDEILNLLPVLVRRLPRNCTVMLLSRAVPPDSFSEMMAKEEIAVIDAGFLHFTREEIKIFFNRNGRFISNAQADEILASTGGWAIGLRALLLAEEKSYNIALSEKYLERFLKTHVWERWDDRLKRFMMCVSVAKELTPELCRRLIASESVLKEASGAEILRQLASENAFLRATGTGTYRFHDLFRDFLLHMLKKRGEHASAALYNIAGDYYFEKEDYFRASEYYLHGKNDDGAAGCLYNMYDYSSASASIEDTLYIIHRAITDSMGEKHPFVLEIQAWAAYVEGRPEDFENYLDKYYKLHPKMAIKDPRCVITGMLLRAIDYREALCPLMNTLSRIPLKGLVDVKAYTPSMTNNQPFFHRSVRDFSELAVDLNKGISLFEKGLGAVIGAEFSVIKQCLYAGFHYERGNISQACEHALAACGNIPDSCSSEIRFCAMVILASALYADGHEDDANEVFGNLNDMIERNKAFYLKHNLRAYLCRIKLSNGDMDAAQEWLKDNRIVAHGNLPIYKIYQYSTTARAHIVTGKYTSAVLLLKKLLLLAERYRRPLDVIEFRVLLAIAYWKKGKSGNFTALDYMEQAIAVAYKYGYTQIFAAEGAELVSMLHRLYKSSLQTDFAGGVTSRFVKTLYIAAVSASKRSKGLTGGRPPENLTFTEKQKTVMRLMCEGCSRNTIALRMGIKPSGVQTHTELIYRKLDVANSIEAIMKIKDLGLLAEK